MARLHLQQDNEQQTVYAFWCPGCDTAHGVRVKGAAGVWGWNRSVDAPTFSPSVLAHGGDTRCHSYVVEGDIRFLSDCSHALAGQTVPLPEWPYEDAP